MPKFLLRLMFQVGLRSGQKAIWEEAVISTVKYS